MNSLIFMAAPCLQSSRWMTCYFSKLLGTFSSKSWLMIELCSFLSGSVPDMSGIPIRSRLSIYAYMRIWNMPLRNLCSKLILLPTVFSASPTSVTNNDRSLIKLTSMVFNCKNFSRHLSGCATLPSYNLSTLQLLAL